MPARGRSAGTATSFDVGHELEPPSLRRQTRRLRAPSVADATRVDAVLGACSLGANDSIADRAGTPCLAARFCPNSRATLKRWDQTPNADGGASARRPSFSLQRPHHLLEAEQLDDLGLRLLHRGGEVAAEALVRDLLALGGDVVAVVAAEAAGLLVAVSVEVGVGAPLHAELGEDV